MKSDKSKIGFLKMTHFACSRSRQLTTESNKLVDVTKLDAHNKIKNKISSSKSLHQLQRKPSIIMVEKFHAGNIVENRTPAKIKIINKKKRRRKKSYSIDE